jgi:ribose transport system ATP-binding protein
MEVTPARSSPLRLVRITKSFDGVQVLQVSGLILQPGQVHALVGANGAGKSTLVKILSGYHEPDPGSVASLGDLPVSWPIQARRLGLAVVHQDMPVAEGLTLTENLLLGSSVHPRLFSRIRWRPAATRAARMLDYVGISRSADLTARALTPAERALLCLARAFGDLDDFAATENASGGANVLLLDEPTALLGQADSELFLERVVTMARRGLSVMLITHRLNEVRAVSDVVSVLRDGQIVWHGSSDAADPDRIAELMFGQPAESASPGGRAPVLPSRRTLGPPMLRVRGLTNRQLSNVSFDVSAGEIVGITGLMGMGQDLVPYCLVGAVAAAGQVEIAGQPGRLTPKLANRLGIALVAGNRAADAFWMPGSAAENLTIARLREHTRHGRLAKRRELSAARSSMVRFRVRPPAPGMRMSSFSGGNQQKISLARWLDSDKFRIYLIHEPTQGVDVRTRAEIFTMLSELARRGAAIVICSADHEALAETCHRVIVLERGAVVAELPAGQISEASIATACLVGSRRPSPDGEAGRDAN